MTKLICPLCKHGFSDVFRLRKHVIRDEKRSLNFLKDYWRCGYCLELLPEGTTRDELDRHLYTHMQQRHYSRLAFEIPLEEEEENDLKEYPTSVLRKHRVVFKWLPIAFSNDMVHGSWWFVAGSFISFLIPIIPIYDILDPTHSIFNVPVDKSIPLFANILTWIILMISGFFFTVGSYVFLRSFEVPPVDPLLKGCRLCHSDEIFASWLFFLAVIPAVPFVGVYLSYDLMSMNNWVMMIGAVMFVLMSALMVQSSYQERNAAPKLLPLIIRVFGPKQYIKTHCATDWLVSMWVTYYVSLIGTIGCIGIWLLTSQDGNNRQAYTYLTGAIDSLVFTVGSAYYLAGSYEPVHEHRLLSPRNSITSDIGSNTRALAFEIAADPEDFERISLG